MFVDRTKIMVKAGNGGNGCISFHREKFIAKGGPNGGDGGNGGDVILRATKAESNLVDLKFQQHCWAKHGEQGMGKQKHGKSADDLIVPVPLGTLVMDMENDYELLADLVNEGDTYLAAQGGKGGKGNMRFMTSTNRAPRTATPGDLGEECTLFLELKTIADVGLVGYPNAGKSTFLNAVSNAQPKTAPYPFTTLNPIVGIIDLDDYTRLTIADIPGLIEGASENIGLGHHFLRHVERTKLLAYVLDMAGTDGRDPLEDLESLKNELEIYQEGLAERAGVIFANKVDEEAAQENLTRLKDATDLPIIEMSAEIEEGTADAIKFIADRIHEIREHEPEVTVLMEKYQTEGDMVVVDLSSDDDDDFDFLQKYEEDEMQIFDDFEDEYDEDDDYSNVVYVRE